MRYPESLVHEYGAKAGILMYVADKLPRIPQMPMVVSGKDDTPREFLKRVDQTGLGWPRIFRSSAAAELIGHEGDFTTNRVDYARFMNEGRDMGWLNVDGDYQGYGRKQEQDKALEDLIENIATSPRVLFPEEGLPQWINVIAAEIAPSKYTGTLIQHPHDHNFIVATIMQRNEPDRITSFTFSKTGLPYQKTVVPFGYRGNNIDLSRTATVDLKRVSRWHHAIADLPEMDPNWTYQLEFGLEPAFLFQVRPFKLKEVANFTLASERKWNGPIVFGITPQEGVDFVIDSIEPEDKDPGLPFMHYTHMRHLKHGKNTQYAPAYLLENGAGILAHDDVQTIRNSKLTIVYPEEVDFSVSYGMVANVVSDGKTVQFTRKN